jgi:glutamate--cysteine ligase
MCPVRSSSEPSLVPIARDDADMLAQLAAYFRGGQKPAERLRIGMEHEKIGVLAGGRVPGYDAIRRLLEEKAARGWTPVKEQGNVIALEHPTSGSITLEPGGQFEHSGAPWGSVAEAVAENDRHTDEILAIAERLGIIFLGVGFRPFGLIDDVPWMPKGRYRVMREYLAPRGRKAHEMMKRTATVQANFDYVDEADAMRKLRLGLGISSLITALFAASPLVDGKPSGYQSYRASCWLECDPDRCGLLRFAFEEGAGFAEYAAWALDVPMFFVYRDGQYRPVKDLTFRRFAKEGYAGEPATIEDWALHLSTLFPEVRLKRYLEVRQADAGPREMVRALPALFTGLFYDAEAGERAWTLVSDWSWEERVALYQETPRLGLSATVRGRPLYALCRELVDAAAAGLRRIGAPAALLSPLEQILDERRSVSDRVLAAYHAASGDPDRLLPALKL